MVPSARDRAFAWRSEATEDYWGRASLYTALMLAREDWVPRG